MSTNKKHISVYLEPAVEQALVAYCEQQGLKSNQGTMFSAGVNAALASFFGVTDADASDTPSTEVSNIPLESTTVKASPRKLKSGKLPKVDSEATEQLQDEASELSNLKTENERLQTESDQLIESSTVVTNKLREGVQMLLSQLEIEYVEREEAEAELSDLKQKYVTARKLPDVADLLNQLRVKRKKSSATFADVEALLELLDESY